MTKIIVLGISLLLLGSCADPGEKSKSTEEIEKPVDQHQHEHSEAIELNDGAKWLVNDEMKPFVLKGEELVNTYIQEGKTDYTSLARQLKDQNSQLIKSCTMEGKSHDELHKWLHPHLDLVKALENEADPEEANALILKLQHSYQEYHEFFE